MSNIQGVACRDKGIAWHFDLDDSAHPVSVFVDSDAVLQIVNNLVSNAIRYTESGYVALTISLEAPVRTNACVCAWSRTAAHTLVISVADTGRGIPKDSMSLIFKKFQQVPVVIGTVPLFPSLTVVPSAGQVGSWVWHWPIHSCQTHQLVTRPD